MPDFRITAVQLTDSMNRGPLTPAERRLFGNLVKAFRKTFLHYTKAYPDHWIHPEKRWTGFPDLPECGCCVILAFLTAHVTGNRTPESDAMIQQYHEFLAAMMPVYTKVQCIYAYRTTALAAQFFPDEKHYAILAEQFRRKAE